MDVLLLGGSGFVGSALAAELRDREHDVTVLSRDPSDDEVPEGVDTAVGDVTAYDSIEGAFAGRDVAVNLVSLSPLFKPPGGASHEGVHLGGTENVVRAAEAHDVDRVVQLSGLGADPDGPTAFLRAKGAAEAVVRDADAEHVIVRPSVVFGEGGEFVPFVKQTKRMFAPFLPVAPLPGGGKTPFQPIYRADVVDLIADCAEAAEHADRTYEFGGPDVLTLADVTRLVYRAEGKRMRVLPVPMPLAGLGLTVLGAVPPFPFGRDQYRSLRLEHTVPDNDVEAFGVDPGSMTTLPEYLDLPA